MHRPGEAPRRTISAVERLRGASSGKASRPDSEGRSLVTPSSTQRAFPENSGTSALWPMLPLYGKAADHPAYAMPAAGWSAESGHRRGSS